MNKTYKIKNETIEIHENESIANGNPIGGSIKKIDISTKKISSVFTESNGKLTMAFLSEEPFNGRKNDVAVLIDSSGDVVIDIETDGNDQPVLSLVEILAAFSKFIANNSKTAKPEQPPEVVDNEKSNKLADLVSPKPKPVLVKNCKKSFLAGMIFQKINGGR